MNPEASDESKRLLPETRKLITPILLILLSITLVALGTRSVAAPPVCSNATCTPVTVTLNANSLGTSTINHDITPDPFKGTALGVGAAGDIRDPKVKYVDADSNSKWDPGETVIYDAGNSGTYTAGDTVINGTTPSTGTPLKGDPKIRFQDSDHNNLWDPGEPVFYDRENNFVFDSSDTIIAGSPTTGGSFDTQTKSFQVGAIVNATSSASITGITGWQFVITYNKTLLVPQGDPWPANPSYPDGANGTVLFGTGAPNWASLDSAAASFGSFHIVNVTGSTSLAKISVFWAALPPTPAQNINSRQLLASVQFELISKPTTSQLLTIGDVAFANTASTPQVFTNVIAGTNATETITNDPPHARFTATQVSGYVFRFDGTGSTDSDGSIKGYYWDFGDGTQDLNFTGGVISMHDFSPSAASAPFNVTLRVVDDQGATGAARDSIGKRLDIVPVSDVFGTPQPSHTFLTVLSDEPPTANFTVSPTNPLIGDTVMFNGSASSDPDGSIAGFSWNFGDSSSLGSGAIPTHSYTTAGTYQVTLTVTDSSGFMTMLTKSLVVEEPATIILTTSASPTSGQPVTLTISASDPDGTVSIIKIDWGDGTVDSLSGSSTSGSHTYAKSGAFTITVSVTDSSGVITSKTTLITVAAPGLGLLLYAAIGIVGVVVAVGALFFLRRRRGKPSTPPTSGPSKG